jgi:predicted TIM-barrel enzyme
VVGAAVVEVVDTVVVELGLTVGGGIESTAVASVKTPVAELWHAPRARTRRIQRAGM